MCMTERLSDRAYDTRGLRELRAEQRELLRELPKAIMDRASKRLGDPQPDDPAVGGPAELALRDRAAALLLDDKDLLELLSAQGRGETAAAYLDRRSSTDDPGSAGEWLEDTAVIFRSASQDAPGDPAMSNKQLGRVIHIVQLLTWADEVAGPFT